jgi:predicted TIM-barrel fold metal-dependent hydrolase
MGIFEEPKIDSHCHILDPEHFAYSPEVAYRPSGQETGSADYFQSVMACYGARHALLVGPNSGYNLNNACLLDAIARYPHLFKGIAVVPNDCDEKTLSALKDQGIVGVAFNYSLNGLAHYASIEPLLIRLKKLGLWAQFQVEGDQLATLLPLIERTGVKLMIDHCGRPDLSPKQPVSSVFETAGFKAMLALGQRGSAVMKISGYAKFSTQAYPFEDVAQVAQLLVKTYGLERCIWASDWPYLKATPRLDYGPMLQLMERDFTLHERQHLFWETPRALFGF